MAEQGASHGRAGSQGTTSRLTGEGHAGVLENHGMSLCITHVRAQCVTFVSSFLPLVSHKENFPACELRGRQGSSRARGAGAVPTVATSKS